MGCGFGLTHGGVVVKKVILLGSVMVLLVSTAGYAQKVGTVATGPHDFGPTGYGTVASGGGTSIDGQTCIFCHTPHGGDTNMALWNRTYDGKVVSYSMYKSSTSLAGNSITVKNSDVQSGNSGACMSCHDGSIGMDVLTNVTGYGMNTSAAGAKKLALTFTPNANSKASYTGSAMSGGLAFLGTDLRNDHPVAISYTQVKADTVKGKDYVAPNSGSPITVGDATKYGAAVPLFGTANNVECSSCHDPHNNLQGNFLRRANTNSQLCLSCHVK